MGTFHPVLNGSMLDGYNGYVQNGLTAEKI